MSRLRRRHLLQLAGSGLTAAAIDSIVRQGSHLHHAWAQPTTGRKLALLVGVNQSEGMEPLSGCTNDVRLQYELLVHRYGFAPENIVIVSESSLELPAKAVISPPNRQAILDAFQNHLIAQAEPEDTVVFHYSGHGTLVVDPNPISYEQEKPFLGAANYGNLKEMGGAIVPRDALSNSDPNRMNVILGSTIFLLSQSLRTNNITLIFDSCHSGAALRPARNIAYRQATTRGQVLAQQAFSPLQAELDLQQELRSRLGLGDPDFRDLREAGIGKGIALTSARATQASVEATISGFRAGIFTYWLTRYLWQTSSALSVKNIFVNLAQSVTSTAFERASNHQDPLYLAHPGTNLESNLPYLLPPSVPAADAVVRNVCANSTVEFWLGGVTPRALNQANSIFEVLNIQGQVIGQLNQTGRDGLVGYGKLSTNVDLKPGTLLRERIRGIPADIKLRVGLHPSLGSDAESARSLLAAFERVKVVNLNSLQEVDYLLGRLDVNTLRNSGLPQEEIAALEIRSIGLFSSGFTPLPSTFGSADEDVNSALNRLSTRLRLLLASRVLKTILNPEVAALKVEVEVESDQRGRVAQVKSRALDATNAGLTNPVVKMRLGEYLTLRVINREERLSLYAAVIAIEPDGDMFVYHPSHWSAAELSSQLGPGSQVVVPKEDDIFWLPIKGPVGSSYEVMVLFSKSELRDTLRSLQRLSDRSETRGQMIFLREKEERSRPRAVSALQIVDDILGDLDRSRGSVFSTGGQRNVDIAELATLTVSIEVT